MNGLLLLDTGKTLNIMERTKRPASMYLISIREKDEITKRIASLKGKSKTEVFNIFQSYSRLNVSHAKGCPKQDLIFSILEDQFGGHRLDTYYAMIAKR